MKDWKGNDIEVGQTLNVVDRYGEIMCEIKVMPPAGEGCLYYNQKGKFHNVDSINGIKAMFADAELQNRLFIFSHGYPSYYFLMIKGVSDEFSKFELTFEQSYWPMNNPKPATPGSDNIF